MNQGNEERAVNLRSYSPFSALIYFKYNKMTYLNLLWELRIFKAFGDFSEKSLFCRKASKIKVIC